VTSFIRILESHTLVPLALGTIVLVLCMVLVLVLAAICYKNSRRKKTYSESVNKIIESLMIFRFLYNFPLIFK